MEERCGIFYGVCYRHIVQKILGAPPSGGERNYKLITLCAVAATHNTARQHTVCDDNMRNV